MIRLDATPDTDISLLLAGFPKDTRIMLHLQPGIYRQKLVFHHDHLTVCGTSQDEVVICHGDHARKRHPDGFPYLTFRTSTVTVFGDDVTLLNLSIENDAGRSDQVGQAVALSLYGHQSTVQNCRISGHQDTLFLGPLPQDLVIRYTGFLPSEALQTRPCFHQIVNTTVQGDVDFIFGGGTAWFSKCHIRAIGKGYVTAPSTHVSVPYGFIFEDCLIESLGLDDDVWLARPWREQGAVMFISCRFEGVFSSMRFDDWGKTHVRFFEHPYVQAPLSKPLAKEEMKRLIAYLKDQARTPET